MLALIILSVDVRFNNFHETTHFILKPFISKKNFLISIYEQIYSKESNTHINSTAFALFKLTYSVELLRHFLKNDFIATHH